MSTTSISPDLIPDLSPDVVRNLGADLGADLTASRPRCECRHNDPARPGRCSESASVRVTVVCIAKGCDCAAGVHLLCRRCLSSWQRHARSSGVKLRVRSL